MATAVRRGLARLGARLRSCASTSSSPSPSAAAIYSAPSSADVAVEASRAPILRLGTNLGIGFIAAGAVAGPSYCQATHCASPAVRPSSRLDASVVNCRPIRRPRAVSETAPDSGSLRTRNATPPTFKATR